MAPYSMDLRTRVLRDADAGPSSNELAAKYLVSRAWVRVKQRRRETGEIAPRKQTKFRRHLNRAAGGPLGGPYHGPADTTLAKSPRAAPDQRRVEHLVAHDRAPRPNGQKKSTCRAATSASA